MKLAWELASEVLVRSLDELQPQTKRLLLLIDEMVSAECARQKIERADFRFSRRDVRQHTAWGDSVLKKHLHRLEELEYLIVHRGGRGQSFVYELYFERNRESGHPVLPGVAGSEICGYDTEKSRSEDGWSPASHRQVAGVARGGHGEESPALARRNGDFRRNPEKHTTGESAKGNHIVRVAAKAEMMAHVVKRKAQPEPRTPLGRLLEEHLEWLLVKNYSEDTADHARWSIGDFVRWAEQRGIEHPMEVTRPILESYQRYLYYYRQKNGQPLTFRTQHSRLTPIAGGSAGWCGTITSCITRRVIWTCRAWKSASRAPSSRHKKPSTCCWCRISRRQWACETARCSKRFTRRASGAGN